MDEQANASSQAQICQHFGHVERFESPGRLVALCAVPRSSPGFNNHSRKVSSELHKVVQAEVGHYSDPGAMLDVTVSP